MTRTPAATGQHNSAKSSTRRKFLAQVGSGLLTLPAMAGTSWSLGQPPSSQVFVSGILDRKIAAKQPGQGFGAAAFSATGKLHWQVQLPARCHGQALHPSGTEICVFARRPGEFFAILDPRTGRVSQQVTPPPGRVFQGHGCYSLDGRYLYTSENAFDLGHGMIGLYERAERAESLPSRLGARPLRRVGEFSSGAIGPHEVVTTDSGLLAVANGGIKTHPDFPRQKLNLESMSSELRLLDPKAGRTVASLRLTPQSQNQQLSLRHLASHPSGKVLAVAAQHQQRLSTVPLLYTVDLSAKTLALSPVLLPAKILAQMKGYCGSVAFSPCGQWLYGSSPKGGVMVAYHKSSQSVATMALADGCGIASGSSCSVNASTGFSSGSGMIIQQRFDARLPAQTPPAAFPDTKKEGSFANLPLHFDNHMSSMVIG